MSVTAGPVVTLGHRFADELGELALPWRAVEAPDPQLLVLNDALAAELGLDPAWLRCPDGLRLLVGNLVPDGAAPVAQAYAGHQFGGYSPRLGDGRALLLGELGTPDGRPGRPAPQGLGPHAVRPRRRRAGRGGADAARVRRERGACTRWASRPPARSRWWRPAGRCAGRRSLPGAVLARVASSHLRVGSFQYARATDDLDLLRRLADHAIARHHPRAADAERPYLALFEAVVAAQASLVARWMLVGFVHGVMNTDNMTISGETIDYGPCAFMEAHDPATVYSSIDETGRYAYGNQPVVAAVEPRPAGRGAAAAARTTTRSRRSRWPSRPSAASASGTTPRGGRRSAPSSGCPRGWTTPWPAPGGRGAGAAARRTTSTTRRSSGCWAARPAATPSRCGRWCWTWPSSTRGWSGGARSARTPTRWTGSTRSTSRATTSSRRRWPPRPLATWRRSTRLLEALADPFTERPGLERYAEPAPEDFGDYRTFCGT